MNSGLPEERSAVHHEMHRENAERIKCGDRSAVPLSAAAAYSFGNIAKRMALQTAQAVLDASLFLLCIHGAEVFMKSSTGGWGSGQTLFFDGILLVCFFFKGLYQFKPWMFWDEMREMLKAQLSAFLILIVYMYALKLPSLRGPVCAGTIFFIPACLLARYLFRRLMFTLGALWTPVLIVGAGKTGELYARKLLTHPFMGCRVMGFLDDDPAKVGGTVAGCPVLGSVKDFAEIQDRLHAEEVVIAISAADRQLLARILDTVEMRVKRVSYIPDMYMLTTFSVSIRDVDGLPLISAVQGLLKPMNRLMKSMMDYTGSILALILLSPVFLLVMIKTGCRCKFAAQDCVGKNLKIFQIYRFGAKNWHAGRVLKEKVPRQGNGAEDPCAVAMEGGGLAGLPRLFNVLRGEMSLVGPRPCAPWEIEARYGATAGRIYRVRPGLTGLWRIAGQDHPGSGDVELYYLYNWSPWLDIVIMLRTVRSVFPARKARGIVK